MALTRQLSFLLALLLSNVFFLAPTALADEDESILIGEIGRLNNQSLLWGPYRPNLYFGVRPRIPKSLMTGLMWGKIETYTDFQNNVRYTCEQNEGMKGYGWDEYDTRRGGVQSIRDKENKVDITTSFIKVPGGANGGGWAARIKGKLREDAAPDQKTLIFLYITQEGGFESQLEAVRSGDASGYDDDVTIAGWSEPLGTYKLVVTRGEGKFPESDHSLSDERPTGKTVVQSLTYPDEVLWQAKPIVFKQLKEGVDYLVEHNFDNTNPPPPWQVYQLENRPGPGNAQIVEKVFEGDFEFDILFSSASDGKDVTSEDLTREIQATAESFATRFSRVFEFTGAFAAEKYQKFGRNMFSNLIGGIGYFYGHGVVDRSYASEYDEENEGFWEETAEARARRKEKPEGPYELFSSIPSRPFFPRGFLWDEGFHLLPIADWDIDLTLEIMKSWFSLMDDDGWIAREQILGQEARSKVPEEFQTQYPHYANPPTLFFVLDAFIDKLRKSNGTRPAGKEQLAQDETLLPTASIDNPEVGHEYLRQLYPLLRRQYDWFRKTQYGDIKTYDREAYSSREAYRWRGRTVQHCLTSGLDDYPRPQPPHPGELHVDLMSWMGMMTKSLIGVADVVGSMPEERAELAKILDAIEHNLDDLHWSHEEGCYCDATIDDYEEHKLVCHRGYVSLMPFLTGLIGPDSPKLGKILALLGDEDELFSPHGIRSLSKKDELYGTEENYWRSPVWINMNYLAIVQLYNIATQDGPHKKTAASLYTRLRTNVVDTVYASWVETGFAWEQYNPETGSGQRTQHFTGWTSLVVKIMAMPDLGGASGNRHDEL